MGKYKKVAYLGHLVFDFLEDGKPNFDIWIPGRPRPSPGFTGGMTTLPLPLHNFERTFLYPLYLLSFALANRFRLTPASAA